MLKVNNLSVSVDDKKLLTDFNIEINDGEIHVLMGPNGAGKSTLCKVLFNNPAYIINEGKIIFNGEDITNMDPSLISKLGMYIVNQSPISIEGVTNAEMLRIALEERTGEKVGIFKFNKELEEICQKLGIPKDFIFRGINEGMSGGERKKNELLHMWMLKPSFIILDEIDSGLDVDALKLVANNLLEYKEKYNPSILIVTHHEKLIELLHPDYVHILKNGTIDQTGDYSLALKTLKEGFVNGASDMTGSNFDE